VEANDDTESRESLTLWLYSKGRLSSETLPPSRWSVSLVNFTLDSSGVDDGHGSEFGGVLEQEIAREALQALVVRGQGVG